MEVKAELVFIPTPVMGHLISMVEMAKHLVLLDSNLSITVLLSSSFFDTIVTAYAHSLAAGQSKTTRIKFINLPAPQADEFNHDPVKFMSILVQTVRPSVKEAAYHIVQQSTSVPGSPRLAGFVLDTLFVPFVDLANELGVPSYGFYTSGAASLGFHLYVTALHEKQGNIAELKDSDTEFTIPCYLNSVSSKFFPALMFNPESFSMMNNLVRVLKEMKGIMINTFWELESHALASLHDHGTGLPPIYPVGPLLSLERASDVHNNLDIMKWLDEQPPSSVVFLCFGSMGSFNEDQVKEIAYALEQSGHRFLWSLRKPLDLTKGLTYDDMSEALPEGFLARTGSIGKIIGWASQVAILATQQLEGSCRIAVGTQRWRAYGSEFRWQRGLYTRSNR